MHRIRIKIVTVGHLPLDFRISKVCSWKSDIFEIVGDIDNYSLRGNSHGDSWQFRDQQIRDQLPRMVNADFTLAITNVPIEDRWYTRGLSDSQVVFTYHEIRDILAGENIPLENIIYRLLYAYSLGFMLLGKIPRPAEELNGLSHDETRGCLFDMNGYIADVVASCHYPQICDECLERLRAGHVSNGAILAAQREIIGIRRDLYYRLFGFVKRHPIWAFMMSCTLAVLLGAAGSLIAAYVYDASQHSIGVQGSGEHYLVPQRQAGEGDGAKDKPHLIRVDSPQEPLRVTKPTGPDSGTVKPPPTGNVPG